MRGAAGDSGQRFLMMRSRQPIQSLRGGALVTAGNLAVLLAIALTSPLPAQEVRQATHAKVNMVGANALVVSDLVHTSQPELVITDVKGQVRLYDAESLRQLESTTLGEEALTTPSPGDFLGTSATDLALATGNGRLVILNGRNLKVIAEKKIGQEFGVQPTVYTPRATDGTTGDAVGLIDQNGRIIGCRLDADGTVRVDWEYSTGTKMQAPLALGYVRGTESEDLVATTADGQIVLVNSADGRGELVLVQQNAVFSKSPLLHDLDGDGRSEVIVTLDRGEVFALRYEPTSNPKLRKLWTVTLNFSPVSAPLAIDRDGAAGSTLIAQLTESSLNLLDPASGAIVTEVKTGLTGVGAAPALIPRQGRYPELAFGMGKTIQVTRNLTEWIDSRGTQALALLEGELRHEATTAVVASLAEDGKEPLIFGISADNEGHLYSVGAGFPSELAAWPTRTPWVTRGGTPHFRSSLDKAYALAERTRREAMAQKAAAWQAELETAMNARDWSKASELAARLFDHDPYSPDFASLSRRIFIRKNFLLLLIAGLASASVITVLAIILARMMGLRRIRRRAELAVSRGEFDEAHRFYRMLAARQPRNPQVAIDLARASIAQRDFTEGAQDVYRKAVAAKPDDADLLQAFARSLLATPTTTHEAATVYERALPTYPEPHWLEYAIGLCKFEEGKFEEAGKRLRAALRGGVDSENLYRVLCDVYLKTKSFSAKSLPVFQQQYPKRQGDREFLIGYLSACIDARIFDAHVEEMCNQVISFAPDQVPAHLHLAAIMMQRNQYLQAIQQVESALSLQPKSPQGRFLLAQCYISLNRRDGDALDVYEKALSSHPEEPALLRFVASIYAEKEQPDDHAIDVLRRAHLANPQDLTILKAIAHAGELRHDPALTIFAVEAMIAQGQLTPDLLRQLALAYAHQNIFEERAEKVYWEALRRDPENALLAAALARSLQAQDKQETDCIAVYEKHMAKEPGDKVVGRQLLKTYVKCSEYERARALAQRLLLSAPDDEEIQRLSALASLYDNKMDAAASEYRRMLDRNPNDEEALVNIALAYIHKMRVDPEAADYYQRALKVRPDNDVIHLGMARLYGMQGDAVKSVESFKTALKLRENNERNIMSHAAALLAEKPDLLRVRWFLIEVMVAYGHLREALEQLDYIAQNHPGQTSNIQRALDTILTKDANNVGALAQRGAILIAGGQIAEGMKVLERALGLQPNSPDIQDKLATAYLASLQKQDVPDTRFRLGKVFYSKGDFDQAIGCFQKTSQDYRWEAESTKMLGKCFTGKGMLDLALQEYKKLVVDNETKELLYDLAQRYEAKRDLVGAKTVYRQLFAADIDYKDVKTRFEMLSGSTSDPMAFEKTAIVQQMSEEAARRYELLDELGRGAMGIVYRARDKELEEIVALKILPDNLSNNPEAVRRFKVEARNARRLSHPNIVRIHDIGEEMGRKYISMEYVDGTDLKRKIKSAPDFRITRKEALHYAIEIADALGYAHRLGIVHRDIKPANIMLTRHDDVKVTDFGIAKLMDQTSDATMVGAVIGTPLYMSPEQVQGRPVDNRADIYSFGILLYEMFNGRTPFTEGDLAYQHLNMDPIQIPGLDEELWAIVNRCLQKNKEDRWPNAEELHEALKSKQKAGDFN